MTWETYLLYLTTVLVFFAHPPGPSQLLYISNSMRHGAARAMPTVAGDLFANSIQIAIAGFGLAGLIHLSGEFFQILKWFGVVYLAWIGIRTIRDASKTAKTAPPVSRGVLFRQGFITSAANPYAVVFFASLFPLFINPHEAIASQVIILGLTYLVIDGAILLIMGFSAKKLVTLLGSKFAVWTGRVSGVFLIIAAVLLSMKDFEPAPKEAGN